MTPAVAPLPFALALVCAALWFIVRDGRHG